MLAILLSQQIFILDKLESSLRLIELRYAVSWWQDNESITTRVRHSQPASGAAVGANLVGPELTISTSRVCFQARELSYMWVQRIGATSILVILRCLLSTPTFPWLRVAPPEPWKSVICMGQTTNKKQNVLDIYTWHTDHPHARLLLPSLLQLLPLLLHSFSLLLLLLRHSFYSFPFFIIPSTPSILLLCLSFCFVFHLLLGKTDLTAGRSRSPLDRPRLRDFVEQNTRGDVVSSWVKK